MVYIVTCSFVDMDGNENTKTIGVFSSQEKAEEAVDHCVDTFRERFGNFMGTYDDPRNYDIVPYEMDVTENVAHF